MDMILTGGGSRPARRSPPASSRASSRARPGSTRRGASRGRSPASGPVANRLAKEAVDRAFEAPLSLGLDYERRLLYLAFASEDAKEGLTAFLEKRAAEFKGR